MADKSPTLDHIEKSFADSYRKEIDQEENIWRSLPFFVAALALQFGAVFQLIERLPSRDGHAWWISMAFACIAGLSTLTALLFLAVSFLPAKFRYIATEPDLLAYAEGLDDDERNARAAGQADPADALETLKIALARQYAAATHNNRLINQRRARWRSVAGLATLSSVIAMFGLVATVAVTYLARSH